jgi:hypothetical protein
VLTLLYFRSFLAGAFLVDYQRTQCSNKHVLHCFAIGPATPFLSSHSPSNWTLAAQEPETAIALSPSQRNAFAKGGTFFAGCPYQARSKGKIWLLHRALLN